MVHYIRNHLFRDIIGILFFLLVFACAGMFFGHGDLMNFINSYKRYLTFTTSYQEIAEFFRTVSEKGSLGTVRSGETYEEITQTFFKRSIYVIITAFILSIILGISKGIFDFRKKYTSLNIFGTGLTSFSTSMPDFFMIIALQWIIMINFPVVRVFGYDEWHSFMFPAILVALYPTMYFARITSAALSSEEGAMYIQVAQSKGLKEKAVIRRHILKKCFSSISPHINVVMTYILSNLLIAEWLIDYKGAAYRLFLAIQRINMENYKEAGLAIELALCFMAVLFFSQVISLFAQHKYYVEKQNMWIGLTKIVVLFLFISLFIIFIILYIER